MLPFNNTLRPLIPTLADHATALLCAGRYREAFALAETIVRGEPHNMQAHVILGCLCLCAGDWARGWPALEWRTYSRCCHWHWSGENLRGKTIRVRLDTAAWGYGDLFMFSRFLIPLLQRGAKTVAIEIPDTSVLSLLRRSFSGVTFLLEGQLADPFDYQTHLLSLPGSLAPRPDVWPSVPYLRPSPHKVRVWRQRLNPYGGKKTVGIVWRSTKGEGLDPRACAVRHLLSLADLPGLQLFSLQQEVTEPENTALAQRGVVQWGRVLKTWDETAACMTALDGIVSVDSGPLHLAGALNKPTWALLAAVAEWRWGQASTTPWYPSLSLIRQLQPGDWTGVIAQVAKALQAVVQADPSSRKVANKA